MKARAIYFGGTVADGSHLGRTGEGRPQQVLLHQADQREIKRLQQELRRKNKALAEAAALLLASKKIQAYWGEDGDD